MTETKGYFGQFGGSFVPEPIQNLLNQLEETFEQYKNDPEFIAEYKHYLKGLFWPGNTALLCGKFDRTFRWGKNLFEARRLESPRFA